MCDGHTSQKSTQPTGHGALAVRPPLVLLSRTYLAQGEERRQSASERGK